MMFGNQWCYEGLNSEVRVALVSSGCRFGEVGSGIALSKNDF